MIREPNLAHTNLCLSTTPPANKLQCLVSLTPKTDAMGKTILDYHQTSPGFFASCLISAFPWGYCCFYRHGICIFHHTSANCHPLVVICSTAHY